MWSGPTGELRRPFTLSRGVARVGSTFRVSRAAVQQRAVALHAPPPHPKEKVYRTGLSMIYSVPYPCGISSGVLWSADLQIIAERRASAKFTYVAAADQQKPVF
jgi:hypothetical protein